MASENGDYLQRFERVEKTLEQVALLQLAYAKRMNDADKQHATLRVELIERMDRRDAKVDQLAGKVDDVVAAIRNLIDRIPPQSLR
jgi:methyl-accepting chemotaxis protein